MKFKQLIKLYETKQKGPPYIVRNKYGIYYYKDPDHELLHRLDGPAVEGKNGTKEWYKDGELHRLDGPAIEHSNGTKEWYKDGKLHRDEKDPYTGLTLPAVEYEDGDKFWYKDGLQHRLDGPAVEYGNGETYWYINDIKLSPKEIEEQKQKIALDKQIASDQDNAIGGLWSTL